MKSTLPWDKIDPLIENALREDFGEAGDLTTESLIPDGLIGKGEFILREEGIVAGFPVAQRVFGIVDGRIECSFHVEEGSAVREHTIFGCVEGPLAGILKAERTALNFLQRLSGIATMTARFVDAVRGTGVSILDTRKTTPSLRLLEKYAVCQGGGQNHRMGLFDMVLIKDNHIDASGGITAAVQKCLAWLKSKNIDVQIEVETRNMEEVREALRLPVHRIMLDNFDVETMRTAVREIDGRKEVEASGNISLENVRTVAETGVDYISVGALTHSVKSLDIALKIIPYSE